MPAPRDDRSSGLGVNRGASLTEKGQKARAFKRVMHGPLPFPLSPFHLFAGGREDIWGGGQVRQGTLCGRCSLQSGRAGLSGVNVSP
jgi:hypothetical protein